MRENIDADIARIPLGYLNYNIRCGIAPAMKADGKSTYWGRQLPDTVDEKTKMLLGVDIELHKPGDDQQKTDDRKQALAILEEPENRWLNARQMLLKIKQAHGSGINLTFPPQAQIDAAMEGYGEDAEFKAMVV